MTAAAIDTTFDIAVGCAADISWLPLYGIDNLRIAGGSIMPCVAIGERAGEMLKKDHKI